MAKWRKKHGINKENSKCRKNRGDEKGGEARLRGRNVKGKERGSSSSSLAYPLFSSINPYALRCRGGKKKENNDSNVVLSATTSISCVFYFTLSARVKNKWQTTKKAECRMYGSELRVF